MGIWRNATFNRLAAIIGSGLAATCVLLLFATVFAGHQGTDQSAWFAGLATMLQTVAIVSIAIFGLDVWKKQQLVQLKADALIKYNQTLMDMMTDLNKIRPIFNDEIRSIAKQKMNEIPHLNIFEAVQLQNTIDHSIILKRTMNYDTLILQHAQELSSLGMVQYLEKAISILRVNELVLKITTIIIEKYKDKESTENLNKIIEDTKDKLLNNHKNIKGDLKNLIEFNKKNLFDPDKLLDLVLDQAKDVRQALKDLYV